MRNINEDLIEQGAIATLQGLGWQYTDGRQIPTEGDQAWRYRADEVVFAPLLREAVARLNPSLPESAVDEVVKKVCTSGIGDLAERNRAFYQLLCNGVRVEFRENDEQKIEFARLIDFHNVANNRFDVVNQLTIKGKQNRRPDVICFVNGLPLAVFELKNPLAEQADIQAAFRQLQTYKAEIDELFVFNQMLIVSDGTQARLGSLTADFGRFTPWKVVDERQNSQRVPFGNELADLLNGLFKPVVFLDYIRHFVLFERGDNHLWIKKIAAYHQFYGVNEAVDCTRLAAAENGDGRIGVMWHTQGSGKSISMLFYVGKLLPIAELGNPTIVVVTDRNDLDGQLFATFSAGREIIRSEPVQAEDRDNLREELAKREVGGVIFTTIQKFALLDGELEHPMLNNRHNIIVISDEAHRSQYGFNKRIDNTTGESKVGYAQHLRKALPNASFIGFTGTPISRDDRDTEQVFGRYVSVYNFFDAIEDGATVALSYEARQIPLSSSREYDQVMEDVRASGEENGYASRIRENLIGLDSRLQTLAADFVQHYEQRKAVENGKAMIVAVSRAVCVKLYNEIVKLRPDWHSDEMSGGKIKIMMTGSASDPDLLKPHIYSHQQKKELEKRFKDPNDPLEVMIVCDMWLTGFDVPCCHTMYIDKPMKEHNLMQAIARVNRVFKGKTGGLIVDYIGIAEDLKQALAQYGSKPDDKPNDFIEDVEKTFNKMLEYVAVIRGQFATPVNGKRFDLDNILQQTDPNALFEGILAAANHIAALDSLQKNDPKDPTPRQDDFVQAVNFAKKGYALCGALPKAKIYEMLIAFADAVRRTLRKNTVPSETNSKPFDLNKLLNRALEAQGVLDLLDLMQRERPNLSLLSDEFLEMVKNSDKQNLWQQSVENFLRSEIKSKTARNIAMQKEFEEKLKEALNRYHNQQLNVLDIIEELIRLSKSLNEQIARGEELGLSHAELAFYDALAKNESAVKELGDQTLKQLAQEITDKLRKSVTIDWQYKEAVRAKMRTLVRIALRHHKYPPDNQAEAIELVLKQAELVAEELAIEAG